MFIDVHCHLDKEFFDENFVEGAIERALKNRVGRIVANTTSLESIKEILKISEKFKIVSVAGGIYPLNHLKINEKEFDCVLEFIRKNREKFCAIGEVGMDFKEDSENHELQRKRFFKIVEFAKEINKPLIIHSRKAEEEVIEILEKQSVKNVIMHCFSGKLKFVERILNNDWFLSIPGNVVFSEHFQKVVSMSRIENLFCETDSPYLHPTKEFPNEPVNVVENYKKIAEIKKSALKEIEEKIEKNFLRCFGRNP